MVATALISATAVTTGTASVRIIRINGNRTCHAHFSQSTLENLPRSEYNTLTYYIACRNTFCGIRAFGLNGGAKDAELSQLNTFSVINILVLFFFLKKFLFGRVNAMLEKRAQMVQADMDEAKQHAADAEKLKNAYEETLSGAKQEAKQIIATAEQNAHAQGSEITAKAQQQADTLLKEAQKEIERERRQTLDGVQGEIADLALAAASKLMEQKVDDQTNRELVNAFLSEEGAGE